MPTTFIVRGRSVESVYREAVRYLTDKYHNYPENLIDPSTGASAENWYAACGDFYEAEARLEAQAQGYVLTETGYVKAK